MRQVICFVTISIFLSCHSLKEEVEYDGHLNPENICSVQRDSIYFDADSVFKKQPSNMSYFPLEKGALFALSHNKGIYIYHTEKKSPLYILPDSGLTDLKQTCFLNDSILILFFPRELVYVHLISGKWIKKIPMQEQFGSFHPYLPLSIRNERVILTPLANPFERHIVHIKTGITEHSFKIDHGLKLFHGHYTPAVQVQCFWLNDSCIAYTSEVDESIRIYHLYTKKTSEKNLVSHLQASPIEKAKDKSMDGLYAYATYEDRYPFFVAAYDQSYFIRVYKKILPLKKNNQYTTFSEREYSMVVADQNLNYVCEIDIPSAQLLVYKIILLKKLIYYDGFTYQNSHHFKYYSLHL